MIPGFVQVPMPACFFEPCVAATTCPDRCLKEIKNHLDAGDVAAVITEAVATNPGVYMPNVSFFAELRRLCDVAQTLLIIDEIGTGFGRTGKMFAIEHFGLVPDIITFAKALSGGYAPIGATITTRAIADSGRGALYTPTFGWTPLSCAAALSNIEIIEKERLSERAAETGNYIRNQLTKQLSSHPLVGAIRGIGLELAIDVVHPNGEKWYDGALEIVRTCEEKGLVVELTGSACAVLLMPPLVIGKRHVDAGLNILVEAFNALAT